MNCMTSLNRCYSNLLLLLQDLSIETTITADNPPLSRRNLNNTVHTLLTNFHFDPIFFPFFTPPTRLVSPVTKFVYFRKQEDTMSVTSLVTHTGGALSQQTPTSNFSRILSRFMKLTTQTNRTSDFPLPWWIKIHDWFAGFLCNFLNARLRSDHTCCWRDSHTRRRCSIHFLFPLHVCFCYCYCQLSKLGRGNFLNTFAFQCYVSFGVIFVKK